jgi:hypothetical protein
VKKLLLILLSMAMTAVCHAQVFPIAVSASLTPPYSLQLSDYGAVGSQRLVVTIRVHDLSVSNLPVKLRIKLESAGATIETPVAIAVSPVFLNGGQVQLLFGDDLAAYFNPDNLTWRGYSKEQYRRTGQLPEGFYRFTVEVLHYHTGRVISNVGRAAAYIALGKPPLLREPQNGVEVGQVAGMPITFSWMNAQVSAPQASVQYTLQLWELRIAGVDPHVVAASRPPFYTHSPQSNTMTLLNPAALLLEPGMCYAWRVTAADPTGTVPFEQGGQSELRTFTFMSRCDSVKSFTVSVTPNRTATLVWTPGNRHFMYNLAVENTATGWSDVSQTFDTRVQYPDMKAGSRYRMRVQPVCNDPLQTTGDYTAWRTLEVPPPKPPDTASCPHCRCADAANTVPPLTNLDLRYDLKAGDVLVDQRGTTRYIVETVEEQSPGIYKGIFLFWAEVWRLKILCRYENLSVNTDNVIVDMDFESVYDPTFLIDVDEITDYIDNLTDALDELTTGKTIRDTLKYNGAIESIYGRGDSIFIVTRNDDGTLSETLLQPDHKLNGTLIVGENGEEVVVTGSGKVLGMEEFQKTGGSARQIEELKQEREQSAVAVCSVQFEATASQKFGFDSYGEPSKSALQQAYPELKAGYRPAYKSVASFTADKVQVSGGAATTTYKDEMGIPAVKTTDAELTIRGGAAGANVALYAYAKTDSTEQIVGKLNLLSYDEQLKKVYLVSVNGATLPNATTLQNELNRVYAPAITRWTVESKGNVSVAFPNSQMTHGGSGLVNVYNDDQKKIINAYGALEKNALYLFFVENVKGKFDGSGDISGYMPLQYQCGFLYENPNTSIIAHELGHGAFNLRHTFSEERFIAAQGKTQNLMDYAGGTELWKHQWEEIQDPQKMWFSFWQDEEDSEYATDGHYYTVQLVALMMGLDSATAYKLAVDAEAPDSEVKSPWDMEERYTYVDFDKQPVYHALSGKTHGVELAITTYALLRGFPERENEKFLLHRFGDCFGHVETKYGDNVDVIDLSLYEQAVETAFGILFKSVQQRSVGERVVVQGDEGAREVIMKNGTIVVDKYNRIIHTTCSHQSLKRFFIEQLFGWDKDIPSDIYPFAYKLYNDIQSNLPENIKQNKWKMYPLIVGHMSEGSSVDAINRRKNMFYYYVESLCYIIEEKYNGVNGRLALNKVKEIVAFGEKADTIRYDAILAFEIAKLLKPNQNEYTIGIPIKYNHSKLTGKQSIVNWLANEFSKDAYKQLGWLNKYLENSEYYVNTYKEDANSIFIYIQKRNK